MKRELIELRSQITSVSLDTTLQRLLRLCRDNHLSAQATEVEALCTTYHYLKQYLLTGYNDAKRETLYRELTANAYAISSQLYAVALAENNRSYANARTEAANKHVSIDNLPEVFQQYVSDFVRKQMSPHVCGEVYTFRQDLFTTLYACALLTPSNYQALSDVLTHPTTPVTDVRLILCSLLLAQQMLFDIRRAQLFVDVYCSEIENYLRQMALIAFVLSPPNATEEKLYSEELRELYVRLSTMPNIEKDLLETQLQLLLSADTQAMQKTINDEIIPVLRNGAVSIDLNIEKSEQALLDEILNPDNERKAMEEVEQSIDRMRALRDSGADIFFGGFSQTKRLPFFYTLMNWFVPFDIDHPQVSATTLTDISADAIVELMELQDFCDSDKYSFFFTFAKVVQQLPPQLREMLKRGEIGAELGEVGRNTANRRRLFLQDLYRFYTLYSSKIDFVNPFDSLETLVFFTREPIRQLVKQEENILLVARQLLKRNYFAPLNTLLDNSFDELNISYLKLKALCEDHQKHYSAAMEWFRRALAFEPNNVTLVKKMAETALLIPDYDLAKQMYSSSIDLSGEDASEEDEYNYALCCLHTKDTEKAMSILYKLYYLHEENLQYRQALAWGLLISGKYEEAMNIYSAIDNAQLDRNSSVRKALTLWLTHNKMEAVTTLRAFVRTNMLAPQELNTILLEQNAACNMAIEAVDLSVITDLVYDDSL